MCTLVRNNVKYDTTDRKSNTVLGDATHLIRQILVHTDNISIGYNINPLHNYETILIFYTHQCNANGTMYNDDISTIQYLLLHKNPRY